jgi:hypothetical protein
MPHHVMHPEDAIFMHEHRGEFKLSPQVNPISFQADDRSRP